jgi:hypothetical protein
MLRDRRRVEKRRRREKRLQRRHERTHFLPGDTLARVVQSLEMADVPLPKFPGAEDPKLERPDLLKFEIASTMTEGDPGRSKVKQCVSKIRQGPLGDVPEIEDWALEEFVWHGAPGDSWHPVEAYLARHSDLLSSAAQQQVRRWKEAQIGLFEVGAVQNDTVTFREWDAVAGTPIGRPFRAITLNIGGVNAYRKWWGQINVTYVAPWSPEDNLYCGMGYGAACDPSLSAMFLPLLGLRRPELAFRPLPWHCDNATRIRYLSEWKSRDWHDWLKDRLQLPFDALVATAPDGDLQAKQVLRLIPSTRAQAREFGIYFEVPIDDDEVMLAGATMVTPLGITSPNLLPLLEYHAYRAEVGPPPASCGQPPFVILSQ